MSSSRIRRFRPRHPVDLTATLRVLRQNRYDPTYRELGGAVWRATRTPDGPASVLLAREGNDEIVAEAWGPGAGWALDHAPELVGERDDVEGFTATVKASGSEVLTRLLRRHAGLRITRSRAVYEAMVATVCNQKVTGTEARRSYFGLIRRYGEDAPLPPHGPRLRLPPSPSRLATLPSWDFHTLDLERKRAETLIRVGRHARRLEEAVDMSLVDARRRLRAIEGVGVWSAAEVSRVALGDGDAVSVGDYHIPTLVSFALAGEAKGDDARMLELLEPFRPHRGRVQRLLEAGHPMPPRRGPRMPLRNLAEH